jgi:hypothetical protein
LFESQLEEKEFDLARLQSKLTEAKVAMEEYRKNKELEDIKEEEEITKEESFKKIYNTVSKLSFQQVFRLIYEEKIKKETNVIEKSRLKDHIQFSSKEFKQGVAEDYLTKLKDIQEFIKKKEFDRLSKFSLFSDPQINSFEEEISHINQKIIELQQTEIKINLPSLPALLHTDNESRKDKKQRLESLQKDIPSKELGGSEVRNMKFDTYRLSGELGRFLGELDHNMVAFALTGDSGAGKSYFSYELAKLFLSNRKTVKYYSLEEGGGKLTRDKLDYYQIGNEMKITAHGTLEDIEKDAKNMMSSLWIVLLRCQEIKKSLTGSDTISLKHYL